MSRLLSIANAFSDAMNTPEFYMGVAATIGILIGGMLLIAAADYFGNKWWPV
jgi:hypothetical protein